MSETTLPSGHPMRHGFDRCAVCGVWNTRGVCLCNIDQQPVPDSGTFGPPPTPEEKPESLPYVLPDPEISS